MGRNKTFVGAVRFPLLTRVMTTLSVIAHSNADSERVCCVNLFWSACVSHDVLVRMWQSGPLLAAHASCAWAGACKWLPNKVSTKHGGSGVFNQIVAYY